MPLQIVQYIAIALGGWFAGETVMDAVKHNATAVQQPANYMPHVMQPTVIESAPLSPYMLIAGAILLCAVAYAVKSVISSVKSCTGGDRHPHNYYE